MNFSLVGARFVMDSGDLGEIVGEVVAEQMSAEAEMTGMVERMAPAYGGN